MEGAVRAVFLQKCHVLVLTCVVQPFTFKSYAELRHDVPRGQTRFLRLQRLVVCSLPLLRGWHAPRKNHDTNNNDQHKDDHNNNHNKNHKNRADPAYVKMMLKGRGAGAAPGMRDNIRAVNPNAIVVEAASPIYFDDSAAISGKAVLVIEDGPTLTHGEMAYGAGVVAARRFGAAEIIDPRPYAVGTITATYQKYPTTGAVLPAMGYGAEQIKELGETINNTPCDLVIVATPIDLRRVVEINRPSQRVRYELQEIGRPTLAEIIEAKLGRKK
jgi:hypothetical protein